MFRPVFLLCGAALWLSAAVADTSLAASGGEFRINVVDAKTGEPLACRIHLKNAKGQPQKAGRMPFWSDHFVFPGKVKLKLPRGNYSFELEHGPEYTDRKGYFTIEDNADDEQVIEMTRSVDMADEGWWSGDLHIHRSEKDIRLLMEAEDLHVAPLITWWNDKTAWKGKDLPKEPVVRFDENRIYDLLGGEDERGGGALTVLQSGGAAGIGRRGTRISAVDEIPACRARARAGGPASVDRHRKALLVGHAPLARQRQGRLDRAGEQSHAARRHVDRTKPGESRATAAGCAIRAATASGRKRFITTC